MLFSVNNLLAMTAFVYFLPHATQPRFKIGKTRYLDGRVQQMGRELFNIARCSAVQLNSERDAEYLERQLHRALAQWRIPAAQVRGEESRPTDGDTEWFQAKCFKQVAVLLDELSRGRFSLTPVSAKEFQHRVPALPKLAREEAKRVENLRTNRFLFAFTPEDRERRMAQAHRKIRDAVWARLPNLRALADLCDEMEFSTLSPWVGHLKGKAPGFHYAEVDRLLAQLLNEPFKFPFGEFLLFIGCDLSGGPLQAETRFRLSLRPPGGTGPGLWEDIAMEELAQLPLSVPGWPAASLALAA